MLSVNILGDYTSGPIVRMMPHASDTDRDPATIDRSKEQENEAEKSRATSDILCLSRDWRVYRTDTAFLHSLFVRPKEDEHGELLKLPRSEMTVQDRSVLPLQDLCILTSRSPIL